MFGPRPNGTAGFVAIAFWACGWACGSCTAGGASGGFDDAAPSAKIDAILVNAGPDGEGSTRRIVEQLDSDDDAVRLVAIQTLQQRTGQTLGYRHDDPPQQRAEAVDRWVQWVHRNEGGAPDDG